MAKENRDDHRAALPLRIGGFFIDVVAIMLTAVCVLSVLPALLLAIDPRLDLIANGVPLLAIAALMMFAITIACRRPKVVAAASFLSVLAPALLMGSDAIRGLSWSNASASAARLKVISTNVWSANDDATAFSEMIAREQPDILFVQEAFGIWKPVLDSLAPRYRYVAGCTYPNECNALVLSKLTKVGDITPLSPAHVTARLQLPDNLGGGFVEVMSVHLSRPPPMSAQRNEIDEVIAIANSFGANAFIAGDFNATPWTGAIRLLDDTLKLERRTGALFSWPTPVPVAPVDHIYAGQNWRTVDIRRGPDIGSDHYPVIATFIRENLENKVKGQH